MKTSDQKFDPSKHCPYQDDSGRSCQLNMHDPDQRCQNWHGSWPHYNAPNPDPQKLGELFDFIRKSLSLQLELTHQSYDNRVTVRVALELQDPVTGAIVKISEVSDNLSLEP